MIYEEWDLMCYQQTDYKKLGYLSDKIDSWDN